VFRLDNSKYNILVVDDVRENVLLVQEILNGAGYLVKGVEDGISALRYVKEERVDLILLDIMMPIMGGIEVCRYLKVEPETASIPVIFLTANADHDTLTKAYRVGGSDYIRKPFFKDELLARVRTRLKLRDYEKNLENKVAERTKEIEDTQVKLMNVLGTIAEGHSLETHSHVKRVADFTYRLAVLSGMDKEEAKLLKDASTLHDIGKLGVRDTILHKRSTLSSQEYKEIQKHSELGAKMLEHSSLPLFKAAKIVALEHHEKYDGTGYPNFLSGKDIHIYGRIVAIADVFDALSNSRSYKKGWSKEDIFMYFNDMKGKHFDPELIDIFFNNVDEFLDIYNIQLKIDVLENGLNYKRRGKIMGWLLRER
jgi:putative two-component system response regulator